MPEVVAAATGAWAGFLLLDAVLNGRWWLWLVVSLAPPPVFLAVPVVLAAAAAAAGGPTRDAVLWTCAACLAAGYRRSGVELAARLRPRRRTTSEPGLTVCAWNTEHWYQQGDAGPFYAFLRSLDADVLLLQEYHHNNFDGTWRAIDDADRLRAEFPGHHVISAHGQVTVSRLPARRVATTAERVLRVDVDVPSPDGSRTVSLFNVHVPVQLRQVSPLRPVFYREVRARARHRDREFAALAGDVAAAGGPALIAGDFNTSPAMGDARRIRALGDDAARWTVMSWPRSWHARGVRLWRIDWALVRDGLEVHRYRFEDAAGLSDHAVQRLTVGVGTRHRPIGRSTR